MSGSQAPTLSCSLVRCIQRDFFWQLLDVQLLLVIGRGNLRKVLTQLFWIAGLMTCFFPSIWRCNGKILCLLAAISLSQLRTSVGRHGVLNLPQCAIWSGGSQTDAFSNAASTNGATDWDLRLLFVLERCPSDFLYVVLIAGAKSVAKPSPLSPSSVYS